MPGWFDEPSQPMGDAGTEEGHLRPGDWISTGGEGRFSTNARKVRNLRKSLEARVGIEPTDEAFAEPCLTTWLPRHSESPN